MTVILIIVRTITAEIDHDTGKTPGEQKIGLVWLFGFYRISNLVGYIMPNPFLYK